jgi:hypothetical protein
MKIKAVVRLDDYERQFDIAVGLGDKTFKWLAMTASQRFASVIPNGQLRQRDHYRGATERAQHLPLEICLSNGDLPLPGSLISDYLQDGDQVFVHLQSRQHVEGSKKMAIHTQWSTLAFTNSTVNGDGGSSVVTEEELGEAGINAIGIVDDDEEGDSLEQIKAKADFMRLVLSTQMINYKFISHQVDSLWTTNVAPSMPKLAPAAAAEIKLIFKQNYDILKELFAHFTPDGALSLENLTQMLAELAIYNERDLALLGPRIHSRTCLAVAKGQGLGAEDADMTLPFGSFLVALILISQSRYNDIYERSGRIDKASDALDRLVSNDIIPFAERLDFGSILKRAFCSDECLSVIREYHDNTFLAFQKYALKSQELPITVRMDHMAEMLVDGKLNRTAPPMVINEVKAAFAAVRKGSIFGREPPQPKKSAFDIPISEEEFTFPEFVEASAYAGFFKFFVKNAEDTSVGSEGAPTIVSCLCAGVAASIDALNKKPETAQPGQRRG